MKRNQKQHQPKKNWYRHTNFTYMTSAPNEAGLFSMEFTSSKEFSGKRIVLGIVLTKEQFPPTARDMQAVANEFCDLCNESLRLVSEAGLPFEFWLELLYDLISRRGTRPLHEYTSVMGLRPDFQAENVSLFEVLQEMIQGFRSAQAARHSDIRLSAGSAENAIDCAAAPPPASGPRWHAFHV
jgi:hypothetical protein